MLETRRDDFFSRASDFDFIRRDGGDSKRGPVRDDLPLAPLDLPTRISVMPLRTERFSGSTLFRLRKVSNFTLIAEKTRGRSDKLKRN